jgi:hypothetical protein
VTLLLLAVVIDWVLILSLVIGLCRSAARADRAAAREYVRRFR